MEVTNRMIKWVYALALKKNRAKARCFVAEGTKCVLDTVDHFHVKYLFCTEEWAGRYAVILNRDYVVASQVQLERMSMLKTPTDVLAVYEMPDMQLEESQIRGQLCLVLDNVQDPGNLGTIIRIADWFGIRTVVCGEGTADVFNPKTVQATMGAISRVQVHYIPLPELFGRFPDMPVYGTFLDGENIYKEELSEQGFIVMGNEGNGISKELEQYMTKRLFVPSFPKDAVTSESLNVGMATAVIVSEFRRRMI